MKVEVEINGVIAHDCIVNPFEAEAMAGLLYEVYRVDKLKQCNVEANVFITGVQSKMNEVGFVPDE